MPANVKFSRQSKPVAAQGAVNADGAAMITADSDALAALQAAADAWNSVSTSAVKFAPLETSSAVNNAKVGRPERGSCFWTRRKTGVSSARLWP